MANAMVLDNAASSLALTHIAHIVLEEYMNVHVIIFVLSIALTYYTPRNR